MKFPFLFVSKILFIIRGAETQRKSGRGTKALLPKCNPNSKPKLRYCSQGHSHRKMGFAADWLLVLVIASVGPWSNHSRLICVLTHETCYQGSVDQSLVGKRADGS